MILRSRPLRTATTAVCVTVLATGLAACGGSKKKAEPAPSTSSTTAAPSPTPSITPAPKPAAVDPLTGGKPSKNSVVAVKIDDTANGRPQVGLDQADVVYVEQVEGGISRLLAVFHTRKPQTVGPVRSVRSNDPQILGSYGAIGFVASGGGGDSLPTLDRSPLKADINDRGGPGFFRDGGRPAPYNLMLGLAGLPSSIGGPARSIGWTWSADTTQAKAGKAATEIHTVVGGTPVDFVYQQAKRRWVRVIGGQTQRTAAGVAITTPNVIVQFCQGYSNPADVDVAGNPGHFTKTVGKGSVVVFRNGHRIAGTWSRPDAKSGTALRDKNNKPIALAPGGAWVLLVENGAPLS